jgi:hypothetical protein
MWPAKTMCFRDFFVFIDTRGEYDCTRSALPLECIFWRSHVNFLAFDGLSHRAASSPQPGGVPWAAVGGWANGAPWGCTGQYTHRT